jgi:hypothetical protein
MRYQMRVDRVINGHKYLIAGEIVYRCRLNDFGSASQDDRETGLEHISVTRHADGSYPFVTVPVGDLKPVVETKPS